MMFKYALAWFPMIMIAVANGSVRQFVYGPLMSELSAHQISCATGILLFFLYTLIVARILPLANARQAFRAGMLWLILTVAFEFSFGLLIAGKSLETLLQDYNVIAGRLWILVLISLLMMPYIANRIMAKSKVH